MTQKCVQCGKPFSLSKSEIDFYKSKDLDLPKRCKSCRDKNKNSNGKYKKYTASAPLAFRDACISTIILVVAFINIISVMAYHSLSLPIIFIDIISFFAVVFLSTVKVHIDIQEFDTSKYTHTFYDMDSMTEHYIKHGKETNSKNMEEYLYKANRVITSKNTLSKTQKKDGDTAYYNKSTEEFVVVAKAGYIRTYFMASMSYYNKQ